MPNWPENFYIGFALAAMWIVLVNLASGLYRHSKGKPIFRPHLERPQFLETWRSGRSLRNRITRLGGAQNCLWVAVNDNTLSLAPHFPFTLMFLPEIFALEYAVKGDAIRSVERRGRLLDRNRVRVILIRADGADEAFEVSLRDPDGFVHAVETIRRAK